MQDISMFDIVTIVLVLLLGSKGLFRGFTKEFFGLVGIIGGIFVASRLATATGEKIAPLFDLNPDNGASIQLMGFVASLIIFWLVAYVLGMILSKIFALSGLGLFDRLLGFCFGALKIFFIFSIIIYVLSQFQLIKEKLDKNLNNSFFYPLLVDGGQWIIKLDKHIDEHIPDDMKETVSDGIDNAVEKTKETIQDSTLEIMEEKAKEMGEDLLNQTGEIVDKTKDVLINNTANETNKTDSTNNAQTSETDSSNTETTKTNNTQTQQQQEEVK